MNQKLFNPDYLYSLCKNYGLQPSKKYGQNFLVNQEIIEKIIEAGDLKKTDTVVEVGPGFGVLTFALAERAKQVVAFEIEKKLVPYWQDRKPENVNTIWGNVLRQANDLPKGKYKVIANLPYQITSAVIRAFLEVNNPPEKMALMVQKEVAERICAKPGEMSLLSVAVQYYADAEIIDFVPRDNFWPMPKVDSAIIVLKVHKVMKPIKSDGFFRLVKAGFANRRKLLVKNLLPAIGKQNRGALEQTFASLGLEKTVRAQEFSVSQWSYLADFFSKNKYAP
ncbi:MAG: 16S rRNA (adenine(1518)-N(6)/adenine(1519)-N(6))-dimethyltransferase RsmA [Candidatus Magasanikbacteria bacterium]|nr:16S rRNA (adenine(1518)-N(6)/adenine(1519)-N(6))-dimethyltransferase RsmA [Candidatus Magasanikbacteria bacterium]